MVWNLALVQEGGLELPLFEEMLEAVASVYDEEPLAPYKYGCPEIRN